MQRAAIAAGLFAMIAGAAAAQTAPQPVMDRFWMHEAARLDQQRLGDQMQVQALTAAQARLRTQQSLQALELARPPAPIVPADHPAGSSVRRRSGERSTVAPQRAPARGESSAPDASRGDLPL